MEYCSLISNDWLPEGTCELTGLARVDATGMPRRVSLLLGE